MKDEVYCEECYSSMKGKEGVDYCLQCKEWRYFYKKND